MKRFPVCGFFWPWREGRARDSSLWQRVAGAQWCGRRSARRQARRCAKPAPAEVWDGVEGSHGPVYSAALCEVSRPALRVPVGLTATSPGRRKCSPQVRARPGSTLSNIKYRTLSQLGISDKHRVLFFLPFPPSPSPFSLTFSFLSLSLFSFPPSLSFLRSHAISGTNSYEKCVIALKFKFS